MPLIKLDKKSFFYLASSNILFPYPINQELKSWNPPGVKEKSDK